MGPCEIHKGHAHTIGPDGSLFACPGFAGEALQSTGHIDGRDGGVPRRRRCANFEKLAAWEMCNDCAFIPVCAGGCTVAVAQRAGRHARAQLPQAEFRGRADHPRARSRGPRNDGGVGSGSGAEGWKSEVRHGQPDASTGDRQMKNKKTNNPKKNGTLRPWLVDVVIDNVR